MRPGKVSQTVWRRSVLKQLHKQSDISVLEPSEAEMCTALTIDHEDTVWLSSSASMCGNTASIGYYAVVKAINDLMTRGAEPLTVQVSLALPVSAKEAEIQAMSKELRSLCEEQNLIWTGLQAEVYPALQQMLVQVNVMGTADKVCSLKAAAPGQDIILCGSIALEGMERILDECKMELSERFVPAFIRQMESLKKELLQSRAIRAVRGHVSAMQQIGSGGILAALWETAEAAGIGLKADLSQMTICQETIEVCEFYRLNPYQMSSTGAILLFTEEGETVLEILRAGGVRAVRLGSTTAENARVITSGEETRFLDRPAPDELALWQEKRMGRAK